MRECSLFGCCVGYCIKSVSVHDEIAGWTEKGKGNTIVILTLENGVRKVIWIGVPFPKEDFVGALFA